MIMITGKLYVVVRLHSLSLEKKDTANINILNWFMPRYFDLLKPGSIVMWLGVSRTCPHHYIPKGSPRACRCPPRFWGELLYDNFIWFADTGRAHETLTLATSLSVVENSQPLLPS